MSKYYVTIEQAKENIRAVINYKKEARITALRYFLKNLLKRHFEIGNTLKFKYIPNSKNYEKIKQKKYGNLPQLVVSGELKNSAINNATITRDGTIIFNIPDYGEYQINMGRDWATANSEEIKIINDVFIKELNSFAKKQVSINSKKRK